MFNFRKPKPNPETKSFTAKVNPDAQTLTDYFYMTQERGKELADKIYDELYAQKRTDCINRLKLFNVAITEAKTTEEALYNISFAQHLFQKTYDSQEEGSLELLEQLLAAMSSQKASTSND